MIEARLGLAKRVKDLAPDTASIHCMIHRQALASQTLPADMQLMSNIVINMVNFVKKSALNTMQFSILCNDLSADHITLLCHTYVR